ncbi:MAG: VanW family protein [Acidimicrobiales bacterium]|nr:VanW family protein [Acidimicrobiales bacterium]
MPRVAKIGLIALAVVGGLLVLLVGSSLVDSWMHRGRAERNVTLAGQQVGGQSRAEVEAHVADLASGFSATPVTVEVPEGTGFETTADELGLTVDEEATVDAVMAAGRSGFVLGRPFSWLRSLTSGRAVDVRLDVDDERVLNASLHLGTADFVAPSEPSLTLDEAGQLRVVEPVPGSGIDPVELADSLRSVAYREGEISVRAGLTDVPARYTRDDAEVLLGEAERLTGQGLEVTAGDSSTTIPAETLRSWITVTPADAGLVLAFEPARVGEALPGLLPDAGEAPVDAGATIVGGAVVATPARSGTGCCAPEATGLILNALERADRGPIELPLTVREPDRTDARLAELGIVEPVASFTTNHACCAPRVQNIHRIADILRGYIIEPGEMLSVNTVVGRRTTENGFVAAPAIVNGEFADEVGGGISQFMTTIFNAAFFAGLDYGEYQAHTIYISRYPYGREATINYPHPDLQIVNNTPYGVLVWPTYSDTSITVTLYSTKNIEAAQTGQTTSASGSCTAVTTERTRTYLETGEQATDTVRALYRGGENRTCNDGGPPPAPPGQPQPTGPPPPTTAPPAITAPPATTSPPPAAPPTTAPPATTAPPPTTPPATAPPPTTVSIPPDLTLPPPP